MTHKHILHSFLLIYLEFVSNNSNLEEIMKPAASLELLFI